MDGETVGLRGRLACHCLLIETETQLVLVDTGFGTRDVRAPLDFDHAAAGTASVLRAARLGKTHDDVIG